jgi:NADPH:quinone reductase-like Zn-dependent oxidoreductase
MSIPIRKAVISEFGGPEKISIVNDFISAPEPNEVQIKVLYASMGGADINMRIGDYPMQKKAPLTPGYAFIGRVQVNGSACSKYSKGELVACMSMYDGDSELVNYPEKYLIAVPEGVDLQQAVALPCDWNTAYGMVYRCAKVHAGQRVFVHGLSGSVGYAIMALSKLCGAEIYGTASESNHAMLRDMGAHPFTYKNKDWIQSMNDLGGAHVVCDPLGFESWDESWSILAKQGGHLIGYGNNGPMLSGKPASTMGVAMGVTKLLSRNLVPFCPHKTSFYYIDKDQKTFEPEMKELFQLLKDGKIQIPIRKVWTLDEVPEAHRTWTQGGGVGTVVVKVQEDKA